MEIILNLEIIKFEKALDGTHLIGFYFGGFKLGYFVIVIVDEVFLIIQHFYF